MPVKITAWPVPEALNTAASLEAIIERLLAQPAPVAAAGGWLSSSATLIRISSLVLTLRAVFGPSSA